MILGINDPHFHLHAPEQQAKCIEAMRDLHCSHIRIGIPWPDLQPSRNEWAWQQFDNSVQLLRQAGIEILLMVGGFPEWAGGGPYCNKPPTTAEGFELWRDYVRAVDARYGDEVEAIEILNEPNAQAFVDPPTPDNFLSLVASANYSIVRCRTLVSGGVAGADPAFVEAAVKKGLLDYVDAVGYHPYPETLLWGNFEPTVDAGFWFWRVRQPQDAHSMLKRIVGSKSLWATEIGWTTTGWPAVDEATQGQYIKRSLEAYRTLGIERYYYYCLWDESDLWWYREAGYGLLRHDFTRKPAFGVFK